MRGMNTQERYDDICKITGLSEDIVRRVLSAQKESLLESLKRGEKASIVGVCTIKPEINSKIAIGGSLDKYVSLRISVSNSLEAQMNKLEKFVESVDTTDNMNGIRLNQIPSLI